MRSDDEAVEVGRHEFVAFIKFAMANWPDRLDRNIRQTCEPPCEEWHDRWWLWTHNHYGRGSVIARAYLVSVYPGVVETDPRPPEELTKQALSANMEGSSWWREDCHIRRDEYSQSQTSDEPKEGT